MTPGAWMAGKARLLARPGRVAAVALTAVTLGIWATFRVARGPFWLGWNSDPDYAYLLNGLNLAHGMSPGHVDHPGTPVQALVALVLRTVHVLSGRAPLAEDVVRRPETYLSVASWLFLLLLAASLALAARAAWISTRSAIVAATVVAAPVLSATAAEHAVCVKPEPILLALSSLLAAATLLHARSGLRHSRAASIAFGAIVGIAVATKINSAPLAALPLVVLGGIVPRLLFGAASVVSFSIAVLPAWGELARLRSLVAAIATHADQYGRGRETVLDPSKYLEGLWTAVSGNVPLVVVAFAGGLVALRYWRVERGDAPEDAGWARALVGSVAAVIASVLVVARHAAPHYLLPAVGLSGLTLGLTLHVARRSMLRSRTVRVALSACALAFAYESWNVARAYRTLEETRSQQLAVAEIVERESGRATIIRYYRSSAPVYALRFGNTYAHGRWDASIDAVHPGAAFYNIWTRRLEAYGPIPWRDAAGRWRPVLLQGTPLEQSSLTAPLADGFLGLRPTVIESNEVEAVYRLAPR